MSRITNLLVIVFLIEVTPLSVKSSNYINQGKTEFQKDSIELVFEAKLKSASNDSLKKLNAHYEYGEYLDKIEEYDRSIQQFKKALEIAQNADNAQKIAKTGNYLANIYAVTGDFKASNKMYELALKNAEETGDAGEIAKISMNLATNYNFTGDYDKAIQHGLYALKIKENNKNLERICYHYISVANIFKETNNIEKWQEYIMKAFKMKDIEGCASFSDIAKIYNALGGIAEEKNDFENALCYYDTLLTLSKQNQFEQGICTALSNSADIYRQMNNFPKALQLATESEQYFSENPYDEIFNNNFKAGLYQQTQDYKKALQLAQENIAIEEINYYSTEKIKCLELLFELNVNLKNYKEALAWNDSLRYLETQLRNENVRKSIEELETKYETEQKQQQIELLTAENELKNQRLRAGIILLLILTIVIMLVLYILQIRRKQAKLIQTDLQQKLLRSQMNPHFMFNVLGSIQNFMLSNDTKKAAHYLSQFASLTRATLEYSASESITLSDEIKMLTNYLELEKMRNPEKFNFEIKEDPELEPDFIQIPPMMIQPFVENSLKHGFKNIKYSGRLSIQISEKKDYVEFIINDNGKGIDKNTTSQHRSMAMDIFEKRRKLIEQKHKKMFQFEIKDLKNTNQNKTGVQVLVSIPILDYD